MVATRQAVEHLLCLELFRVPAPALISLISPPVSVRPTRVRISSELHVHVMPMYAAVSFTAQQISSLLSTTSPFLFALRPFTLGGRGLRSNVEEF